MADTEKLHERLEAARSELNELLTEQMFGSDALREAEKTDREETLQAARSGGSIAGAVRESKARAVRARQ